MFFFLYKGYLLDDCSKRDEEFDKQPLQRFLFFVVQTSKESFINLLSRLSNLLQFHLPYFCQFHDVTSSVEWISLLLSS